MFGFLSSRGYKERKIKMIMREEIEPHEVLLDALSQEKEREIGISEKRFEVPLAQSNLKLVLFLCLILLSILYARTFQLQTLERENLSLLAKENKFINYKIQAERGVIYDKNMIQLVSNKPSFDLLLNIKDLPEGEAEKEKILKEVSQILKKDINELKSEINGSKNQSVLISKNLDHDILLIFETKIKELKGFKIVNNTVRDYKDGQYFSQLIGYTGRLNDEELQKEPQFYSMTDYVGRTGLEKFYEQTLRKNPGELKVERDALGNMISQEVAVLPESGKSLVLWLDSELQKKIKDELEKKIKEIGAKKGAAVALDPRTGGVLALVSLPSYDNNLFNQDADFQSVKDILNDPLEPLFNRAIAGGYLTGSTIKPLMASAALEEKVISKNTIIDCNGVISIKNPYYPGVQPEYYEYHDWAVHGLSNVEKALAESCNIFFYTVGGGYKDFKGLGVDRIKKYLTLFGWGQKTGIDLPGEKEGIVPDPQLKKEYYKSPQEKIWRIGDTYYLSIGQSFLKVSPLQLADSFAAIANGGKLFRPQVVQKIIEGSVDSPKIIEEMKPQITRENFISPENIQIIREGMRQGVTGQNSPHASSILLNSLPVTAAAKTGTAQLGNDYYNNWIGAFAPYEDPQIVLVIVIENVKGLQGAAVPVAKEVLNWYFSKK